MHGFVREWTRSGLLDESQAGRLTLQLRPDLKRTNFFLRVVLFLFTTLVVAAVTILTIELLSPNDTRLNAFICAIAASICIALAEWIIVRFRVYRFGSEEALTVCSLGLAVMSGLQWQSEASNTAVQVTGLVMAAIGGLSIYARYGFVYAGVGAIVCAALLPFPAFDSETTRRLAAAAILAIVYFVARRTRLTYGDDFPGDDYGIFQASAWAGLYLSLNLQVTFAAIHTGLFYWCTYVMIWVLPVVGLYRGLRDKERMMMNVSGAMAVATFATNKAYLGLPQQTWDPILFGLFLIGTAILLRRWLTSAAAGERHGFTAARILRKDERLMTIVSTASAGFQPHATPSAPVSNKPEFGGGRSGGAGATGNF